MILQSINYLLKRLFKLSIISTLIFLAVMFIFVRLLGGGDNGIIELKISTWWVFLIFGFGISESVKYFRFSNLLGMTRRQHAIAYLLSSLIGSAVFVLISVISSQFVTQMIVGPFKLIFENYGSDWLKVVSLVGSYWLVCIFASLLALIFNKLPKNVGIYVAIGAVFLGIPLVSGAGAVVVNLLESQNVIALMKVINFIKSVPAFVWDTLLYVVVIGGYWLVQRSHVSRAID
ncbi:hypothetical protein JXA27_05880 [Aerococcaceae bacterium zg-B36]|uniref:hypothetical protein n=1 Tax=Aerococcaceae bacterium zg-252 TaxID=2796928 RepID=UPI001BD8A41F|nr:hypothetical protein [Aerococcaceae bacterium zg-B36]